MFKKKRLRGLVVLLAVLVVTANVTNTVYAQPDDPEQTIEMEMDDDYFKPEVITIPSGKTTKLQLKNEGKKEHTFTVEKLGIDVEVQPGEEKTISVKPEDSGTYELICRYHVRQGMVGKVIVE